MTENEKLWEKIRTDIDKEWKEYVKESKKARIPDETPEYRCSHYCGRCPHCGRDNYSHYPPFIPILYSPPREYPPIGPYWNEWHITC